MKSKRFLLLLFIVQIIFCLSLSVFASGNNIAYTMESEDSIVGAGETFDVTVSLAENSGFVLSIVNVTFDPAQVSYEGYSLEGSVFTEDDIIVNKRANENFAKVTIGDPMAAMGKNPPVYSENGVVAVLKFKVRDAYEGKINISLDINRKNTMMPNESDDFTITGDSLDVKSIDWATHKHTEVTDTSVEPTCLDTGLTEGKHCSMCEQVLVKQETIPALGHDKIVDVVAVSATCTKSGNTEGWHCSRCDAGLKQETVPAKGHNEKVLSAKQPTCSEEGLTQGKQCRTCGVVTVKQQVIAATGHVEEVVAAKDATCSEAGLTEGKKCSVCGEITVEQQIIPAGAHTEEIIPGKAASCTETGLSDGKKCTVCGEITLEQKVLDKIAHTELIINGKAATCTESGLTDGKKCSVCGEIIVAQEVVEPKSHVYDNNCDTKCNNCDAAREVSEHTYGEWNTTKEATKKETGVKVRECSECGNTESAEIHRIESNTSIFIVLVILVLLMITGIIVFVAIKTKNRKVK